MGVRGLTTYINSNQESFLKSYKLADSNLVIDGHSLCAQLYGRLNCFSAFGGDYDKFAVHTKNFFKNLRKCCVTPFVIFDGSYESKKLKTAYGRLRSKINGASRLDPVTQSSLKIFPLLLRDVFKEVISELNILYSVCEFEADNEIATMAKHLGCPVLSYDSDFFVYNVLYIPFNTLEYKPMPVEVDGVKHYVLECKLYKVDYLLQHFGGLHKDMLPLLATMLGNDYVEKKVFRKFFSHLKLPKSKKRKNEQQRCIHGIFKWLQHETLDSAISKILGRLKKQEKYKIFAIIKKSVSSYNRSYCRSLQYFNFNSVTEENTEEIQFETYLKSENTVEQGIEESNSESSKCSSTDNSDTDKENTEDNEELSENESINELISSLPTWFSEGVRENTIPHTCLNLFTHHLHFCSPQAEDYSDEDAFLCVLPILRYTFDLITDFNHDSCTYVSREKDCNLKRLMVGREYSTSRITDKTYHELSPEELKQCFLHFITQQLPNFDIELLNLLPENFHLSMISLIWWVKYCKVSLAHVHSVFMCYIMLDVIDEKTGNFRGYFNFHNKHSKKLNELKKRVCAITEITEDTLFFNKNKVVYEDCLVAANVLLKSFEIDDTIRKRPKSYDSIKVHTFAQYQCCLQQFNSLNILCRKPFQPTKYSKCYNGTFLYNMALKLEAQLNVEEYVMQFLKGSDTVLMFYKSICLVYGKCYKIMNISHITGGKKRRRKKKVDVDEVDLIMKEFEFEVVI